MHFSWTLACLWLKSIKIDPGFLRHRAWIFLSHSSTWSSNSSMHSRTKLIHSINLRIFLFCFWTFFSRVTSSAFCQVALPLSDDRSSSTHFKIFIHSCPSVWTQASSLLHCQTFGQFHMTLQTCWTTLFSSSKILRTNWVAIAVLCHMEGVTWWRWTLFPFQSKIPIYRIISKQCQELFLSNPTFSKHQGTGSCRSAGTNIWHCSPAWTMNPHKASILWQFTSRSFLHSTSLNSNHPGWT